MGKSCAWPMAFRSVIEMLFTALIGLTLSAAAAAGTYTFQIGEGVKMREDYFRVLNRRPNEEPMAREQDVYRRVPPLRRSAQSEI